MLPFIPVPTTDIKFIVKMLGLFLVLVENYIEASLCK